jgi:predicted membrane-bound spermidine synthase
MAEISKLFKIMLIIDVIVAFVYGILYFFVPNIVYDLNDAPFYDPHFWRLFGGAILSLGIGAILSLIIKEWEKIKLFVLVTIIFLIITAIGNISSALYLTRSPTNLVFHWLDTIIIIILIVLNGFFFIKESKE